MHIEMHALTSPCIAYVFSRITNAICMLWQLEPSLSTKWHLLIRVRSSFFFFLKKATILRVLQKQPGVSGYNTLLICTMMIPMFKSLVSLEIIKEWLCFRSVKPRFLASRCGSENDNLYIQHISLIFRTNPEKVGLNKPLQKLHISPISIMPSTLPT